MIPLALSQGKYQNVFTGPMLAVDIGGTKSKLALFEATATGFERKRIQSYRSADYSSFLDIAAAFMEGEPYPEHICLAIAGPVINGRAQATNLQWGLDEKELKKAWGVADVHIINDLEANAYGLATLKPNQLLPIHKNLPEIPRGNGAVISPGTGLGEAGLYWNGQRFHPFAAEGGHCDFTPRTDQDIAMFKYLRDLYGHVSFERVVAGPGIYNIFRYLRDVERYDVPPHISERLQIEDPPRVISDGATKGVEICFRSINLFYRYLAIAASNLALKYNALGGIFVGGGIIPNLTEFIETCSFVEQFLYVGRLRALLEQIPVVIIMEDETPLLGAAFYAANY